MPQSLDALARQSTDVVRGDVLSVESFWNDDHTMILTDVRIAVREAFKGGGPAEISLRMVGGKVGDLQQTIVGSAAFEPDEEVVVFAAPGHGNVLWLVDFAQAKMRVETDMDGGRWVSRPGRAVGELVPRLTTDAQGRLPWEAFAEQMRTAARGGRR